MPMVPWLSRVMVARLPCLILMNSFILLRSVNVHEVLIRNPQGFPEGLTSIIKMDDPAGMNFSCLRLHQGEHYEIKPSLESVHLLMVGKIIFSFPHQSKIVER